MRTLKILKGFHRPFNRNWIPQIRIGEDSFSGKYIFTDSCRYDIGTDQSDINKLTGLSFSLSPHKDSVRVGWRYSPKSDMIELLYYIYEDGKRTWGGICEVPIGEEVELLVERWNIMLNFQVSFSGGKANQYYYSTKFWKKYAYVLGLFFGGNRPAPHNIEVVKIDKPYT